MIKVDKFDKLFLSQLQRDVYTFHTGDNNCRNIKVGDDIEIDGISGKVESLEWFVKMFNGPDGKPLKGDSVTILVNQNKDEKDPNAIYDWGSFPLEKNFNWNNHKDKPKQR